MGDSDSHSGEKVLLYVFVGIGLVALAYLFFKDQFRRDNVIQPTQTSNLGNIRIDELESQTMNLEMQTNLLKERLKLYDYKLSKFDNGLGEVPRTYTLSGMSNVGGGQPARAGSVMTVRTTAEDKVRQRDFGMN